MEARALLDRLQARKEPLHQLTAGHNGGIYNGPQFVRNYVDDPAYGVPNPPFLCRRDFLSKAG
jgi:type I restriction enzyme S subunit